MGGRIKNDDDAIIRISGPLSNVGGTLIFGCFGMFGASFLWEPTKCGGRRRSDAWVYHQI